MRGIPGRGGLTPKRHYQTAALTLALGLGIVSQATTDQPQARFGSIGGIVFNERHSLVAGATVLARRLGVPGGSAAPWALTDAEGRFLIRHLAWGTYAVAAEKPGAGYPLTSWGIYGSGRLPEVSLSPESPNAKMSVQIGPKAATLTGALVDADTGKPIAGAGADLRTTRAPVQWLSTSVRSRFSLLVPSQRPVAVTISAPGYGPWRRVLDLAPGEHRHFVIRLRPGK